MTKYTLIPKLPAEKRKKNTTRLLQQLNFEPTTRSSRDLFLEQAVELDFHRSFVLVNLELKLKILDAS